MQKVTFPYWDFPGLLICCRAHLSVLETVETICVAISLRLTPFFHKMTGLYLMAKSTCLAEVASRSKNIEAMALHAKNIS